MKDQGTTNSCPLCNASTLRILELEEENAELLALVNAAHKGWFEINVHDSIALRDCGIVAYRDGKALHWIGDEVKTYPTYLEAFRALKESR